MFVIVHINTMWPTINEPGRRRSYVKRTGSSLKTGEIAGFEPEIAGLQCIVTTVPMRHRYHYSHEQQHSQKPPLPPYYTTGATRKIKLISVNH
jgi:hypothetical protein